jgi:hypothetical protein
MPELNTFIPEEDYYINEEGRVVMTAAYLLKRGYCCGSGCKHCPYKQSQEADTDNSNG